MSRCVVCDYCSELDDGQPRAMRWKEKEQGYVCSVCEEAITRTVLEHEGYDPEIGEFDVGFLLESDEVLEFRDLVEHPRKDRES